MGEEKGVGGGGDEGVASLDIRLYRCGGNSEDAEADIRFLANGRDVVDGGDDLGMGNLADQAHAGREIVGADEYGVDACDLDDGRDILDGLNMFGLDDDGRALIGIVQIFLKLEAVAVGAADADAARAEGGVFGAADDFFCFFGRVDHGHDDAGGSGIERFFDIDHVISGDAHEAGGRWTGCLQGVLDICGG